MPSLRLCLFADSNRLARRGEKFVAARRLADHKFQVLRKEVAFLNEALGLLPHLFKVSISARITLRDRSARIAAPRAFFRCRRQWNRRSDQAHQSVGSAHLWMTQVPTRIARQRHRHIRQTDAAHLVAIAIDGWNAMRIGLTLDWRQGRRYPVHGSRAEVETDHLRRV